MTQSEHLPAATSEGWTAWTKFVLVILVAVALVANWCLALLYFFAWAHYDGGDRSTENLISGIGALVFAAPTLICLWPSKVKLGQRLLVCMVTFALGYLLMAALG